MEAPSLASALLPSLEQPVHRLESSLLHGLLQLFAPTSDSKDALFSFEKPERWSQLLAKVNTSIEVLIPFFEADPADDVPGGWNLWRSLRVIDLLLAHFGRHAPPPLLSALWTHLEARCQEHASPFGSIELFKVRLHPPPLAPTL